MKNLIIVRHGEYWNDHLIPYGREQISSLALKLKKMVGDGKVTILTSTTERARESAQIIDQTFQVGIEGHEVLWSDRRCLRPENLPEALELVRSKKDVVDTLIIVTHLEYVENFPEYFGREELGVSFSYGRKIAQGNAWFIDCEAKTITFVSYV